MKTTTKLKLAELTSGVSLFAALFMSLYALANAPISQPFIYATLLMWAVFIFATYFVFRYISEIDEQNKRYW